MQDLLLLFAKVMPEEMIIEQIEESLTEYKITRTDEAKKKLTMYCMLMATKSGTEGKDIEQITHELGEVRRIKERMNSENS
jgi:hypothetical protein